MQRGRGPAYILPTTGCVATCVRLHDYAGGARAIHAPRMRDQSLHTIIAELLTESCSSTDLGLLGGFHNVKE
eukprot:5663146-Pleurochrysis_carterae.AAC.1